MSESYFLLSKNKVFEQLESIQKYCDYVSYSLKTNYEVGRILEGHCWFSVHSIQALKLVEHKDKVWFFAQAWNKKEISEIIDLGTNSFVVDNEKDLRELMSYFQDKKNKINKKINLLLRMRLKEHTVHTGKHFVFGFYSDKINELIPKLRQNQNIKGLGIHFHRKTQNVSEWSLKEELSQSISEKVLEKIDYVNIGGGIPSVYKNFKAEMLPSIFEKINKLRNWLKHYNIKTIIEPGRYIAAPSVKLVSEIKNIYDGTIIVNCSVFNSAMDTFIANLRLLVDGELESGVPYTIKGCTPDSIDIFRYRVYLKNPKIGDKIIFLNAGAYNFSTDFCMLPKLKTLIK